MINGDSISITSVHDKNQYVSVQYDGHLALDRRGQDFKLDDLKNGFLPYGSGNGTQVFRVTDDGEEWELVS